MSEDMISKLPDSLISQILLYLPTTKEAVRTSVLSTRWKRLWLLIPKLDLDSSNFPDYNTFVGFMDKFLDFSREHKSCLHKLKLSIHKSESDQSCVTPWIDFVATTKLEHLDVEFGPVKLECLEVMPLSLFFVCDTLFYLRLHRVFLGKSESVSLPCLKKLRLEHNVYANEAVLESLISGCPVLEDLEIVQRVDANVEVVRVRSQTLTSLSIAHGVNDYEVEVLAEEIEYENLRVLIDAPRLMYLNLGDNIAEFAVLSSLDSLTKVDILGDFYMVKSADEVDFA
ncbi:PREDICTED: FBD-associated F-box protein At5g44490-like [Camelina sativa]|uniref:FBD-associated F-box protein At5g44490-like n=1 Tax=Camelina sativa TaxID=90675 RepID=A0ABM0XZU5_CAMSA|nr:PREDICTED: FBD-associated F-box protein At5g44490-like [Camelina sativa]